MLRAEFYEMFLFAASRIGLSEGDCTHVKTVGSSSDGDPCAAVAGSALILLAGGDTRAGWSAFEGCGMAAALRAAHAAGAVLVGISAGAIHLGTHGFDEAGRAAAGGGPFQPLVRLSFC